MLTATDLDVTISCGVEAEVKEGGSITLPVKKLFGIVRELSTPEVDCRVLLAKESVAPGDLVRAKITSAGDYEWVGEVVDEPAS